MSGLTTLWQIASREITERARSRAYLATTGLTVLIVLGLIVIPTLFGGGTAEAPSARWAPATRTS